MVSFDLHKHNGDDEPEEKKRTLSSEHTFCWHTRFFLAITAHFVQIIHNVTRARRLKASHIMKPLFHNLVI
jgi:hypothetical protein